MTLRDWSDRQVPPAEGRALRWEFGALLLIALIGLVLGLAL
jgi:hypothetical protein